MTHKTNLKPEQIYKLEQASVLIADTVHTDLTDPKILSTWLSVAGNYCHQIAREVVAQTEGD